MEEKKERLASAIVRDMTEKEAKKTLCELIYNLAEWGPCYDCPVRYGKDTVTKCADHNSCGNAWLAYAIERSNKE